MKTLTAKPDFTATDKSDFTRLEGEVRAGTIQVGKALNEIHDRKLYLLKHPTWKEYCEVEWEFTPRRSRQLMSSAEVVAQVAESPEGNNCSPPTREGQTRELEKAPAEERGKIWADATEKAKASGKTAPTARDVKAAVQKTKPKQPAGVQHAPSAKGLPDQATGTTPKESATSDPEPWNRRYHPAHDKATGLLADFKAAMIELARLDGTDAAFVSWIVEKDWRKTIDGIAATLDAHRVTGWASSAEKSRLSDNRPFLFKIDKAKGRKSA